MKKVLLHICCGICALYCIEKLKQDGFYIEGLFFNPNIEPQVEYSRRKQTLENLKRIYSLNIIEGEYNPSAWHQICDSYQNEPEGGKRCFLCYQMRLVKTLEVAKNLNFNYFTTTLTVSPHKKSAVIIEIGKKLSNDKFLPRDFKKEDGFKKTTALAKKYNFYHQNYCGCVYSIRGQKTDDRGQMTEGMSGL
jgi:predicted adenine nucleotide alpha hydrolase (AANH) superfamily ATPase